MSMRVTNSMVLRTTLNGVYRVRDLLADTQEQSATGLRVNRPSDDPPSASRATQLRGEGSAVEQYGRNVAQARTRLVEIEDAVGAGKDVMVRARELAVQGANGTLDAAGRKLLAQDVESIFDEMLAASNSRTAGGWIFGGTASGVPSFVSSGAFVSGSPPPIVSFAGNSNEVQVAIDDGRLTTATFDGRRVFMGDTDGDGLPDSGRDDVFAVLGELWRALDTNDQSAVSATLDRIDQTQLQFDLELAHVGAATKQLDAADDRLGLDKTSNAKALSDAQDADTVEVFSRLTAQETALQAALETAARASQPSLLDFLK